MAPDASKRLLVLAANASVSVSRARSVSEMPRSRLGVDGSASRSEECEADNVYVGARDRAGEVLVDELVVAVARGGILKGDGPSLWAGKGTVLVAGEGVDGAVGVLKSAPCSADDEPGALRSRVLLLKLRNGDAFDTEVTMSFADKIDLPAARSDTLSFCFTGLFTGALSGDLVAAFTGLTSWYFWGLFRGVLEGLLSTIMSSFLRDKSF